MPTSRGVEKNGKKMVKKAATRALNVSAKIFQNTYIKSILQLTAQGYAGNSVYLILL